MASRPPRAYKRSFSPLSRRLARCRNWAVSDKRMRRASPPEERNFCNILILHDITPCRDRTRDLVRWLDHQQVADLKLPAEQEMVGRAQRFHSGSIGERDRPERFARPDAVDDGAGPGRFCRGGWFGRAAGRGAFPAPEPFDGDFAAGDAARPPGYTRRFMPRATRLLRRPFHFFSSATLTSNCSATVSSVSPRRTR